MQEDPSSKPTGQSNSKWNMSTVAFTVVKTKTLHSVHFVQWKKSKSTSVHQSAKTRPGLERRRRSSSATSDSGTIVHGNSESPPFQRERGAAVPGVHLTEVQFQELQAEISRCHQQLREKDLAKEQLDARVRQVSRPEEKLLAFRCVV